MSIGGNLAHVLERLRREPLAQLLLDGLGRFGLSIQPFYLFEESMPPGGPPAVDSPLSSAVVRPLGPADMESVSSIARSGLTAEFFQARLRNGNGCLGMFDGGQLIAFSWYDLQECNHEGWRFPLREDEAYLFDAFTLAHWRGRGVAPYLRYRVYRILAQAGRTRCFSVSIRTNRPAIRFKQKLGAKLVARGWVVTLLGRWRFGSRPPERAS
jgi:GNAT superfamily N-acetyltransferase